MVVIAVEVVVVTMIQCWGTSSFRALYSMGLKHNPFLVGTNSSLGFQNCLMSMYELPSVIVPYTFPLR